MKKLAMVTLLSASALVLFANTANAEVKEDTTDVGVSFKDEGPNKPGKHKPYKDNLAVIWTPNTFDFGEQKAVGGISRFNNQETRPQYMVVNDDRKAADNSDWKLTASLSSLVEVGNATNELPAQVTFKLGELQSYNIGEEIDPATNDFKPIPLDATPSPLAKMPENHGITLGKDGTVDQAVTLEAGAPTGVAILSKDVKNDVQGGVATQIKETKLVVTDANKNAGGKTFAAQVTWSLDDLKK